MRIQLLFLASLAAACTIDSPGLISSGPAEPSPASSAASARPSWIEDERGILENHIQLTSSERFRKAGESYFSPDGRQIIFQAIEKKRNPKLEEAFYQMYVADLVFDGHRVRGIDNIKRLSPPGSSNTCGWFHTTEPGVALFGSTLVPPQDPDKTGYQRDSSRYVWQFPQEMDIVRCEIAKADGTTATLERVVADPQAYLAECVVSPDGRYLVFCQHKVDEGRSGGDLLILDFATGKRVTVTQSAGYDGGPFFSPDGKRLCYRSDRRGDDLLQIFVSELAFDAHGNITGVEREFQLTDNGHVNWAPYWHPNGRYLIYATSQMGHDNYEVFIVDADSGSDGGSTRYGTRRRRITNAAKFDGLPVFNSDASKMMWTCQRDAEQTSQVWLADFVMVLDSAGEDTESIAAKKPAESEQSERAGAERKQVLDPETGLYFIYDPASHKLSIYDPKTHKVREDLSGKEIERAMKLFGRPGN